MSFWKRFSSDRRGATAMLMALLIIPLMALVGFGMDFTRLTSQRGHVQAALDAAALAGARAMQTVGDSNEVDTVVNTVFDTNMDGAFRDLDCQALGIERQLADGEVEVRVSCDIPSTLSAVVGHDGFTFHERAVVAFGVNKLEVAMMFDVSGSMSGSRIAALKDAAEGALDVLFDLPVAAEGDVRVAMNAYATSLNAGDFFEAATGLDPDDPHDIDYERYSDGAQIEKSVTNTCVSERMGAERFSDAAPGPGQYIGANSEGCPAVGLVPLTDKRDDLDDFLEALPASGWTAGHLGVAWSWYLLSPDWAGVWPAGSEPQAYDTEDLAKVAILMTDGQFNQYYASGQGDSADQAIDVCDAMKDAGVVVFSVAFSAPYSAEQTLKACATSDDHFFNADNSSELEAAYQTIAVRISDLRVAS